jgi:predicted MFS family arabinose efflux permease
MGIGNFGFFVEPMNADLDVGRGQFGWALSARLAGFALTGPFIGRLLDRRGARAPMALAAILVGASTAMLGLVTEGWHLITLSFVGGAMGFWGSSSLFFTTPVAKWFIMKRGRAMSIVFIGTPIGIAIAAPISQLLIDLVGWRLAWVVLGLSSSSIVAALAVLFVRSKPEDMGLYPDGSDKPASDPGFSPNPTSDEYSWTARDAMRTTTFWRIAIAFGTLMMGMSAMAVFWVPHYTSIGFSARAAALAISTSAFTEVVISVCLIPFIDRIQPRFIAVGGFALLMSALITTIYASSTGQMFLAAALGGGGIGIGMLLQAQLWPHYFGRLHIGAIRGISAPVTLGFSAVGSPATGMIFDATGSYLPAWWTIVSLLAAGSIILLLTPKPSTPEPRRPDPL